MTADFSAHEHLRDAVANRRRPDRSRGRAVRSPTLAGAEEPAQRLIDERLRGAGFDVAESTPTRRRRWPIRTPASRRSVRRSQQRRRPLAGRGGGRSLHLNGHIDVVPVEDAEHWRHDPWAGEVADGAPVGPRLRRHEGRPRRVRDRRRGGRGRALSRAPRRPDRLDVIEEETHRQRHVVGARRGHVGDAVLVREPTDLRLGSPATGVVWCRAGRPVGAGHSM